MRRQLAVLRILHPFPSLLVALLTIALVPIADRGAPVSRYLVLGLGMLLVQFAIGLVNDLADMEDDRAAKPWKPLVRGMLSPGKAAVLAVVFAGGALLLTLQLPFHAWLLGVVGLCCGLAYDLYFKRTDLSWLPYSLAFPLIPIWVFVASGSWRPLLWWTLPLGALLGFALQLSNQAPDAEDARNAGLPGRLGARRSRLLALAAFGVAAGIVGALLLPESRTRAVAVTVVALGALAGAPWSTKLFGRDGLFALLAVSSLLLAVVFLSAV